MPWGHEADEAHEGGGSRKNGGVSRIHHHTQTHTKCTQGNLHPTIPPPLMTREEPGCRTEPAVGARTLSAFLQALPRLKEPLRRHRLARAASLFDAKGFLLAQSSQPPKEEKERGDGRTGGSCGGRLRKTTRYGSEGTAPVAAAQNMQEAGAGQEGGGRGQPAGGGGRAGASGGENGCLPPGMPQQTRQTWRCQRTLSQRETGEGVGSTVHTMKR